MKVVDESKNVIRIENEDGSSITVMTFGKEVTISFGGGHRFVKQVQNREDGHSSVSMTKLHDSPN